MGTLEGKVAVVTGGGSGIGFAIARRFAEEGARLVLVGRRRERLERAAAEIGRGAAGIPADVGVEAEVKAVFDRLERVDLLVTCAGGAVFGTIDGLPPEEWKRLFEGRFFGQIYACHHAVPKMPAGGVILLCSGIAAAAHVPEYSGGSALCGAVNALGRNLAVELAPRGIRVNVISPGLIEGTEIENNLDGEKLMQFWQSTVDRIPAKRAGRPGDTAEAAHFLATCAYASGIVLDVDGGWTAA
ncbi:MAG: SDR family oxidoreductase [Deltaproteobacteria bacterium]|nr:SDR family oxidoreductase [Deltaproteobacteria bacterium]